MTAYTAVLWLLHPLSRAFVDVGAPDPLFQLMYRYSTFDVCLPYIIVGICAFAKNTDGVCKQNTSRFTPTTL